MSQPLVSIIVPIYKVEKYIERFARTIFLQTYENLEIIFVDDCTPDHSIEKLKAVIANFPNRAKCIRIIHHRNNKGLAEARLTGLQNSNGDYLLQLDSDDWAEPEMVEALVTEAERTQADITTCDYKAVCPHKTYIINIPHLDQIECLKKIFTGQIMGSVWNRLIRRSLYFDNEIFPKPGLDMLEDLSVMYRLIFRAKRLAYVARPLYNYNQCNVGSYTRSRKYSRKNQDNRIQVLMMIDHDLQHDMKSIADELRQSFIMMKTSYFIFVVLKGYRDALEQHPRLFADVTYSSIKATRINWIQKWAGIFQLAHFPFGVWLLKKIDDVEYSLKLFIKSIIMRIRRK